MKICWQFSLFVGLAEPHKEWTKATLVQHPPCHYMLACLTKEPELKQSLVSSFDVFLILYTNIYSV